MREDNSHPLALVTRQRMSRVLYPGAHARSSFWGFGWGGGGWLLMEDSTHPPALVARQKMCQELLWNAQAGSCTQAVAYPQNIICAPFGSCCVFCLF